MSKRIELFTMKGCEPCDDASDALVPFAKESGIPLTITPVQNYEDPPTVPTICVIAERDGKATRKCIEGYGEDTIKKVEELLEEI